VSSRRARAATFSGREAKFLLQVLVLARLAEAVEAERRALRPHPAVPAEGARRFDSEAARDRRRSTASRYSAGWAAKSSNDGRLTTRARNAVLGEQLLRAENHVHFRAGGEQHQLGLAPFSVGEHVAAARHALRRARRRLGEHRQLLARERQRRRPCWRSMATRHACAVSCASAGRKHHQVRDGAQGSQLLDGLVGGPVLAEEDRVVGVRRR
jgi:hypothetical protein